MIEMVENVDIVIGNLKTSLDRPGRKRGGTVGFGHLGVGSHDCYMGLCRCGVRKERNLLKGWDRGVPPPGFHWKKGGGGV